MHGEIAVQVAQRVQRIDVDGDVAVDLLEAADRHRHRQIRCPVARPDVPEPGITFVPLALGQQAAQQPGGVLARQAHVLGEDHALGVVDGDAEQGDLAGGHRVASPHEREQLRDCVAVRGRHRTAQAAFVGDIACKRLNVAGMALPDELVHISLDQRSIAFDLFGAARELIALGREIHRAGCGDEAHDRRGGNDDLEFTTRRHGG